MDFGLWTLDFGILDFGILDFGLQTSDFGLLAKDYGLRTMKHQAVGTL